MAKNVAGDLLSQNYELQKKFNEFFRQINQNEGYPFNFKDLVDHLQSAVDGKFLIPIGYKNHPKLSVKNVDGYELEVIGEGTCYETILSIRDFTERKLSLNNSVVINRSILGVSSGDIGTIITISEPFSGTNSSDILCVMFGDKKIINLKPKEVNLI